jgi:large subunit ribosomal protein L23
LFFCFIKQECDLPSKIEIKFLVQEIFDVKIVSVNSYIKPGKTRRLSKFEGLKNCYKRVFITLL